VVGLVLLQVMVALSAVIYFRRNKTQDGIWRTMIAPILATAGMVASLYLMITNISLLTGASAAVNRVILLTVPVVVIAGLAWAAWLRRFRPAVYAGIAAADAVDATDAAVAAATVPSLGADQIGEADSAKVG
jgi:hypothetical protein